ncbi:MAG: acetyl-CoA carboxylase biotin carboxyl carrier protein [Pseudomonadota bacterium]
MALSFADVAEILKVIDASEIEELVLEVDGVKLVVRRQGAGGAPVVARQAADIARPAAAAGAVPSGAAAPGTAGKAAALGGGPTAPVQGAVPVPAPMVGTFYRRPSPEEPPFVEEGARVVAGQTLCLLEVMKLFTQVEASIAGTVVSLPVVDGEGVEYGQPLAWILAD